ncbi:MAG: tRNA modification GTPase [Pirellulaceae bacterium]|nr:tRNA modification GTPase [Pirellulaceae bacterium]
MNEEDTIAAVASPPGGAFRGIVRISGPGTMACLRTCFQVPGGESCDWDAIRQAHVVPGAMKLGPPLGDLPCDVYFWPGPRSFTRQTVAEIHTIGSPPLLEAVLRTVCAAGARLARPGEFTLRAFLAGRIDLTQAEAVLGVIDARDRHQLDSALQQLAGGLARPLAQLRDQLLDLLADLEAGLDFVGEDIRFITDEELEERLAESVGHLRALEGQMTRRAETGEVFRIALAGWPNVGKSSLWNALVGQPAAIVSDSAGTTRDYLTRRVTIGGLNCLLIDTAGIDPAAPDDISATAQQLGTEQTRQADLRLWCIDATRPLNDWERANLPPANSPRHLRVLTKIDQGTAAALPDDAIPTSSRTGAGLDRLREAIFEALWGQSDSESSVVTCTALRCRDSLRRAADSLQHAREQLALAAGEEIVAAEIRTALDELGQVVGAVYTEDLLDRVFSRFCLGK